MDTQQALLRAILLNPADDVARLVYADWLQENGDEEYAEFIRVSVEIATLCQANRNGLGTHESGIRQSELFTREAVLSRTVYPRHMYPVFDWLKAVGIDYGNCVFNRGDFLAGVSCTLSQFMEHAKSLFSAHPVTAVILADRHPHDWTDDFEIPNRGVFSWYTDSIFAAASLPFEVMGRRGESDHNTREEALDWLSARCVAYGRYLAGLPPLPGTAAGSPE